MGDSNIHQYICHICRITCSGPENYHQHLIGAKHLKREIQNKLYGQMPAQTNPLAGTSSFQSTGYSCKVCQTVMSGPEAYTAHMKGKPHAKKLKQQDFVKAIPSGNAFPTDEQQPTVSTEPEKMDINPGNEIATSFQQPKLSDTNSFFYCQLCQVHFTGPESAQSHYAGTQHKKKLNRELIMTTVGESFGRINITDQQKNICKEIPAEANATEAIIEIYNQDQNGEIKDKDDD